MGFRRVHRYRAFNAFDFGQRVAGFCGGFSRFGVFAFAGGLAVALLSVPVGTPGKHLSTLQREAVMGAGGDLFRGPLLRPQFVERRQRGGLLQAVRVGSRFGQLPFGDFDFFLVSSNLFLGGLDGLFFLRFFRALQFGFCGREFTLLTFDFALQPVFSVRFLFWRPGFLAVLGGVCPTEFEFGRLRLRKRQGVVFRFSPAEDFAAFQACERRVVTARDFHDAGQHFALTRFGRAHPFDVAGRDLAFPFRFLLCPRAGPRCPIPTPPAFSRPAAVRGSHSPPKLRPRSW